MSDRAFVDTGVLIDAHDVDAGRKHEGAAGLLADLRRTRRGVLSTQELRASELEERHRLAFRDALIVCSARTAGAATLLSENFTHGQRIDGVLVENPFR